MRFATIVSALVLVLGACNPHPDSGDDNNNQPGVNNNNAGNTNDNQTNTNHNNPFPWVLTAEATLDIAGWTQLQNDFGDFEPVWSAEDCNGNHPYLDFYLQRPIMVLISASDELWITSEIDMEFYVINQNPEDPWSFWVWELEIIEFWALDPFWSIERFPESWAQVDGFKFAASSFICGMGLDMFNLGCHNQFVGDFFKSAGYGKSFHFEDSEFGETFVLGVLR